MGVTHKLWANLLNFHVLHKQRRRTGAHAPHARLFKNIFGSGGI